MVWGSLHARANDRLRLDDVPDQAPHPTGRRQRGH